MTVTINDVLQNEQVDVWGTELDSGFIDIYQGTQPVDPTDPPSGTLLVSLALQADAYGTASGGSATGNLTISGTAINSGTAQYAQQRNAANTAWMYGSVTATGGGGDVQLDTTTIVADEIVSLTSSIITQAASN